MSSWIIIWANFCGTCTALVSDASSMWPFYWERLSLPPKKRFFFYFIKLWCWNKNYYIQQTANLKKKLYGRWNIKALIDHPCTQNMQNLTVNFKLLIGRLVIGLMFSLIVRPGWYGIHQEVRGGLSRLGEETECPGQQCGAVPKGRWPGQTVHQGQLWADHGDQSPRYVIDPDS